MRKTASIFLLIAALFSCRIIDLSELDISMNPSKRNQIVSEHETLWIEFSEKLLESEAESFFQVKGPEGLIEGDITWSDRRLSFRPYNSLTTGYRYSFIFNGTVKTADGRNFEVSRSVPFYAGTNAARPILLSNTPAEGSITGAFEVLNFSFSKSMNPDKFEENFSVTPSAEMDFLWSNRDMDVAVSPKKRWNNQKVHRWKVDRETPDSLGIPLAMEYSNTFLVQMDVLSPTVQNIHPAIVQQDGSYLPLASLGLTDLDNENDIYFIFDEATDFVSLNSSFSINPDMDGHFKQISPSEFVYVKSIDFVPEKEYTITLKEGLEDITGNGISEDIIYEFIPAVPAVNVLSINVRHADGNRLIDSGEFNSSNLIFLNPLIYFGKSTPDYSLDFIITIDQVYSISEVTAKQNFIQGISCTVSFPPGLSSPFLYDSRWNTAGNVLTLQYKDFKIAGAAAPVFYRFRVAGGSTASANTAGSYLLEDVSFYFNAQGMSTP